MTHYDSTLLYPEKKIGSYLFYSLLHVAFKTYTSIMSYAHFGQHRHVFHFFFKFHRVMKISEIVLHVKWGLTPIRWWSCCLTLLEHLNLHLCVSVVVLFNPSGAP